MLIKKGRKEFSAFLKKEAPNLNGFIMLDELNGTLRLAEKAGNVYIDAVTFDYYYSKYLNE
jgi:hypothetical protein